MTHTSISSLFHRQVHDAQNLQFLQIIMLKLQRWNHALERARARALAAVVRRFSAQVDIELHRMQRSQHGAQRHY
jgi:hypothetical protein